MSSNKRRKLDANQGTQSKLLNTASSQNYGLLTGLCSVERRCSSKEIAGEAGIYNYISALRRQYSQLF